MRRAILSSLVVMAVLVSSVSAPRAQGQQSKTKPWNNAGDEPNPPATADPKAPPAAKHDISGIWDGGFAAVAPGGQTNVPPLTPEGEAIGKTHHSGNGARATPVAQVNDPLSTLGDPTGFPRDILFELRPFQIVQMPKRVLILYLFERRWRVIWTDGRALPTDPDPRWYGYSVGTWVDDNTLVVTTIGTNATTWLNNSGDPHSEGLKVEERYHRVNRDRLELTVTIDDPTIYTKTWVARDKLPFRRMSEDTDLMEMIPSASEAANYRRVMLGQK